MTTRKEVQICLVDEFNIWDDMAETLCDKFTPIIAANSGKSPEFICDLILQAEKADLGVDELPHDDYFSEEEEFDDTDEWDEEYDEEEEFEDFEEIEDED